MIGTYLLMGLNGLGWSYWLFFMEKESGFADRQPVDLAWPIIMLVATTIGPMLLIRRGISGVGPVSALNSCLVIAPFSFFPYLLIAGGG